MLRKLLVLITALMAVTTAFAETFKFAAIGDMPYGDPAKTHSSFRALIGTINARQPAFTIHVGDIKAGTGACSDALFQEQLDFMNSFDAALVYTPGDNEWTDCHRNTAGNFDPLDRLQKLRSMFFTEARSLGKGPIALERQSDLMPLYKTFVENARFIIGGVQFVTVHVVGSNNNLEPRDRRAANEFFDRDEANVLWLRDTFTKAVSENAKAVVVAMQADMFEFDFGHLGRDQHLTHSGFRNIAETLVQAATVFARPVLLIYGDSHNFRVHTPFRKRLPTLLGLEVFGADQMHAVEVTVNTDDPAVFSFRPIWNPLK
jgi:hypothetical protein